MHAELEATARLRAQKAAKAMERRGFDARVVDTAAQAAALALELIPAGASVAWGGSMTLARDLGLMEALRKDGTRRLIDRDAVSDPEQVARIYREAFGADWYLLSANAISMDGQLVNVDGRSNRVAALAYGPKRVLVVAGANKLCPDLDSALTRARFLAATANAERLGTDTPCRADGLCHDCLSDDCICCNLMVTRKSREKGRIAVILVAEDLGF